MYLGDGEQRLKDKESLIGGPYGSMSTCYAIGVTNPRDDDWSVVVWTELSFEPTQMNKWAAGLEGCCVVERLSGDLLWPAIG
jgi:hypothetical protein